MKNILADAKDRMRKSVQALKDEFNTIRTGRASSALFDIGVDTRDQLPIH